MQIVIEIDEEEYKKILVDKSSGSLFEDMMTMAVQNGIPLPKGHGRLIECERLQEVFRRNVVGYAGFKQLFDNAPTIVEAADKSEV